jgi:hypothetical protein
VSFFVALASATPEQLGWDDTIRRVQAEDKIQYEITVGNQRYRTVRLIADFRANDLVSRATRVWEVKKMECGQNGYHVPPGTPSVVLKDLWINRAETQEALIIKQIRFLLSQWMCDHPLAPDASNYEDTSLDPDPEFSERKKRLNWLNNEHASEFLPDADPDVPDRPWGTAPYDRYFPHVLAHGYVKLADGLDDCSIHMVRPGQFDTLSKEDLRVLMTDPAPQRSKPLNMALAPGSTMSLSQGGTHAPDKLRRLYPNFRDALHYRMIIEHLGERLDETEDLRNVFHGLKDAAIGSRGF